MQYSNKQQHAGQQPAPPPRKQSDLDKTITLTCRMAGA
ncbi:hypothetical protein QF022_002463 [Vogesella perlucida]|nr:hypothetical protein [Vogesella perlucida]